MNHSLAGISVCLNLLVYPYKTIEKGKKVKDTALDFRVRTGGADLPFFALQPGSAMI